MSDFSHSVGSLHWEFSPKHTHINPTSAPRQSDTSNWLTLRHCSLAPWHRTRSTAIRAPTAPELDWRRAPVRHFHLGPRAAGGGRAVKGNGRPLEGHAPWSAPSGTVGVVELRRRGAPSHLRCPALERVSGDAHSLITLDDKRISPHTCTNNPPWSRRLNNNTKAIYRTIPE